MHINKDLFAQTTGSPIEDVMYLLNRAAKSLDSQEHEAVIKVLELATYLLQVHSDFTGNIISATEQ